MNEELEAKRQEKIANFKIDFTESPVSEADTSSERPEISSVSESPEHDGAVFGDAAKIHSDTDISSGEEEIPEIFDRKTRRQKRRQVSKRRRKKARGNRIVFRVVWLTMVVLVSILLGEYLMVGINDLLAVGREENKSVSVTIPKEASIDRITDILYENHIINNKVFFKLYATVTKSTSGYTRGTFDVPTNKDYQALINYLQSDMNRTDIVTLRFTEGMNIVEYSKLLEKNNVCNADDFLDACDSNMFDEDYEFIGSIKNTKERYYKLEGYLFPDTYDFYVGEDIDSVVRKFLANYRRKVYQTKTRVDGFDKKVTIEERAEKIGMTMEEVVTLASLIQAEAADERDMYMISSVMHNRLDTLDNDGVSYYGEAGLKFLQLDSTIFYPYATQADVPVSMRNSYNSTYNTYDNEGLPAGPICNPGVAALEAAVSPNDTNYFYFCHKAASGDEPAEAFYASTMNEHIYNQYLAGLITE